MFWFSGEMEREPVTQLTLLEVNKPILHLNSSTFTGFVEQGRKTSHNIILVFSRPHCEAAFTKLWVATPHGVASFEKEVGRNSEIKKAKLTLGS
jgi:hypothetical protein